MQKAREFPHRSSQGLPIFSDIVGDQLLPNGTKGPPIPRLPLRRPIYNLRESRSGSSPQMSRPQSDDSNYFAWQEDYAQTSTSLATPKNKKHIIPKKPAERCFAAHIRKGCRRRWRLARQEQY
ncbi:hypothetical protein PG994_008993 [Apiospora phragmitis]|uniref:Uncharacterized protein n=1 Tax=Apiospora phragmitis TaxID=2905665 RepID=A0ABR1UI11_9PEZI